MKPKLTVIVPVYNVEKYLPCCLDSLISQTLKEIEIILVNDGSTDGSERICRAYAEKDTRIKVFSKENGGLSDARNYGMERAESDVLGFVDFHQVVAQDDRFTRHESVHRLPAHTPGRPAPSGPYRGWS